jgi:hypothetical protein
MALEAAKAIPQGVQHRYGQFRVVPILDQLLNDLALLGDVSLAFGNVPIDLRQVFAFSLGASRPASATLRGGCKRPRLAGVRACSKRISAC